MANQTRQLAELLTQEGALVEVVQVNAPYRPTWVNNLRVLRALFRLIPYLVSLWRACGRADVVHVMANSGWSWDLYAAPAVWIAVLRHVPVVVNYRGGEAESFLARAAGRVRVTMGKASFLVLPSGYLQDVFARHHMAGIIVPNVVDLERFRPRLGSRQERGRLVVTRHLEPIYGIETALRAFALIRARQPHASLAIAGTGPLEAELKALAASLGVVDGVQFIGHLDREGIAELYAGADIALNPSTVDNMPNSILEALASGLAIVSTNVGGVPHLVRDGETALLVQPNDPAAMAAMVCRLLENRQLRERMAARGLEAVQAYSWNTVRVELARVYLQARQAMPPSILARVQEP